MSLAYFFSFTSNSAWMMSKLFYSYWDSVRKVLGALFIWAASAYVENSASLIFFSWHPFSKTCDVWVKGLASAHARTPYYAVRAKNYLSATALLSIVERFVSIKHVQVSFTFRPSTHYSQFSLNNSKKSDNAFLELFDLRLSTCCFMKLAYWSIFFSKTEKWNLFIMRKFCTASNYGRHSSSFSVLAIASVVCMKVSTSVFSSLMISVNSSNVLNSTVAAAS